VLGAAEASRQLIPARWLAPSLGLLPAPLTLAW